MLANELSSQSRNVVVVGNGMVGHKFIESMMALVDSNVSNSTPLTYNVITISEEPNLAYDRVQLSSYFSGKTAADLSLVTAEHYRSTGVDFRLDDKVVAIDSKDKNVVTESGERIHYDKLILATGSVPFVPSIPGCQQPFIHVYRTLQDLDAIKCSSESSKSGVVIGGGLLGLEAANALCELKLKTKVVEFSSQLMPVQLDKNAGALLRQKIEDKGIEVLTGKNTLKISAGTSHRYRLEFSDSTFTETDMIVFSAGIRPQDFLARQSSIKVGERGGIVINQHCETSIADIYAIGECALWQNKIYGLVAPGYKMAKVAASHCIASLEGKIYTQGEPLFSGADMSTKLKLLGVEVASIGDAHATKDNAVSYSVTDELTGTYKKIVLNEHRTQLLGAVMVGCSKEYAEWLNAYLNRVELPEPAEQLLFPLNENGNQSTASKLGGIANLPATAQICSCNDVSKNKIIYCIKEGAQNINDIKAQCNVGTGCGGCTQLVSQILDNELEKMGMEVDDSLCTHFSFNRVELFNIIKVKKIRDFESLLKDSGKGRGCEICKPAAASIFASLWNEPVLDSAHISLQDTNDSFLANMQKDGTYSVVPRIPGGEITPAKLIVIGQVAQDFGLYTKITGGQRIDLFGAQLHELPKIWKRLVDAGFETGHAYGKALRTVKSCVGTSWCRYGVQDSTSMAIYIENRYRGIRSPHKIKMAVSGCARECAEAQSKDYGVIATEKGWNLYVGGNGGMRPRHADLFASDLTDEMLIKYIDRIMMFYIQTAERLQRTSVWLENLAGGLSYLKQVIIEDKLSLNHELESQMLQLINSYQCEWSNALQDPVKLKRFSHFINSDEADPEVKFVTERQQIRPAKVAEKLLMMEQI